jgi:hypothetical protein
MTESDGKRRGDTGQRSHKGPAFLSMLFRREEREKQRRERDRLRAKVEQADE